MKTILRTVDRLPLGARLLALAAALLVASACQARESSPVGDSNALVMTAEIALQRDDCGRASSDYARAAEGARNAHLAARAAAVALDCGQFPAAQRAAARWQQLKPKDPAASRAAMRAAIGRYRIDQARVQLRGWLRMGGVAKGKGIGPELQKLADQSGVEVTLAMLRGVHVPALQSAAAQLALARLALEDWNDQECVNYARGALAAGANRVQVQLLLSQAYVGLGQAAQAMAAARAAQAAVPGKQPFAQIDTLMLLGRNQPARAALAKLAMKKIPALQSGVQRRLGLLDFNAGDYDLAEQDFSAMLQQDKDSSGIAVYYLSQIAERRGHMLTALRGYQLLAGTSLEQIARQQMARLLMKAHDRREALALLAPAHGASPSARLAAEVAQAELLANNGAGDAALARIDDALARFPGHPDLLYQRAIVLERAHHTNQAIAQLQRLHQQRPDDATIGNALGYIMTDHHRDLARAEQLIRGALHEQPNNPAILDSLGWLEFQRGRPRAALPLLQRAFGLDQDGDIGAHWGEVLWALGEHQKALRAWSRAQIADPGNALVRKAKRRAGVPELGSSGPQISI